MTVAVVILVLAIAGAIVGFAVYAMRSASQTATQRASAADGSATLQRRPHPIVSEFHVRGDTATVLFDVPLGDSEAGEHLTDLLSAAAIEHIRARVADGLPLDGVTKIEVLATRDGHPVPLTTVELPEIGSLPDAVQAVVRSEATHDPIAAVQAVVADSSVAVPSSSGDELESVTELIELSTPTEAHLRAIGVDTSTASLEELVVGLFRVNGYDVQPAPSGSAMRFDEAVAVYSAARGGATSVLVIHPHAEGSHPELEDHVLSEFAVGVAQSNPATAILVTDKFSPYEMYEREKRDKRLVFVTRERLQAFVDSFGLS